MTTIIIGAGLSGLRTAQRLKQHGKTYTILEARDRIGGRVLTEKIEDARYDLGPAWFWPQQERRIVSLMEELELDTFPQYRTGDILVEQTSGNVQRYTLPPHAVDRSMRVDGGIEALIQAISRQIPQEWIKLQTRVQAVTSHKGYVVVETNNGTYEAEKVIIAMPPRLVAEAIEWKPFPQVLTTPEPTWMAGHAKGLVVYPTPFWREQGLSGQVMSYAGPLQEIHDASPEHGPGALVGFFGMPALERQKWTKEQLTAHMLRQLENLFGPQATSASHVRIKDWAQDPFTATAQDSQPIHDFPDYKHLEADNAWTGHLFFAGTETSEGTGGHLEGALLAADRVVGEIVGKL